MIIQRRLGPKSPGSKKYREKYGNQFVCIRYKYDSDKGIKIKTVELLISEEPWQKHKQRIPMNKILTIQIGYEEIHLQKLVKAVGGKWNKQKKLWEAPYSSIKALGLEDRIMNPP